MSNCPRLHMVYVVLSTCSTHRQHIAKSCETHNVTSHEHTNFFVLSTCPRKNASNTTSNAGKKPNTSKKRNIQAIVGFLSEHTSHCWTSAVLRHSLTDLPLFIHSVFCMHSNS